ncbi:MAG: hypothetical protein HY340_00850 [Candidatus Kerfeldbacteria bacterium]|nr:hypothetical protein [Candidatus Kerfeldbacteria bacterium]
MKDLLRMIRHPYTLVVGLAFLTILVMWCAWGGWLRSTKIILFFFLSIAWVVLAVWTAAVFWCRAALDESQSNRSYLREQHSEIDQLIASTRSGSQNATQDDSSCAVMKAEP